MRQIFRGGNGKNLSKLRLDRSYRACNNNMLAKILASDSIEKVCGRMFAERGHVLVEKPGIKKDELLKIIGEYDGLVVRSGTKVRQEKS